MTSRTNDSARLAQYVQKSSRRDQLPDHEFVVGTGTNQVPSFLSRVSAPSSDMHAGQFTACLDGNG